MPCCKLHTAKYNRTVHLFQRISSPFTEILQSWAPPNTPIWLNHTCNFVHCSPFFKEQAHLLQRTKRLIVFPMVPKTPVIKVATPESQNFHSLSRLVGESVIVFIFVIVFLFVMPCLLIPLINCQQCNFVTKSPYIALKVFVSPAPWPNQDTLRTPDRRRWSG